MLKYNISSIYMADGFHTLPEVENNTPPETTMKCGAYLMCLTILGDVFATMAPYKYQGGGKSSINTQQ